MRNFLCWTPSAVRQVINPFAEHMPDSLFQAVHTDWPLQVATPAGKSFQDVGEAAWAELTPPAFLDDFLREDRPHALAAILGETGSGKSHLVHWMRLHVREDARRMVLVVRKSGTSLRAIVREIIGKLPADQQQTFLDTFNAAGDGAMGREGRKHELLNHLAQAVREDVLDRDGDELEEELLRCIPDLLQDPYMRKEHFLREGGVVGEIVDHIFAESNAKDRPDRRRLFGPDDLALGGMDFVHATKLAKDAIQLIELDQAVNLPVAIAIINRNLDKAIARTLSFAGDRIEELMARLRAYLKEQGRELVLLVEEFARLQGIDRALLQAITSHGDERQCRMRTAIAVTTGFFASVAETAYMRTTHIVDMDRSAGRAAGQAVTPSSLAEFAARYLNAARLGRERIEQWSLSAGPGDAAPSRCDECPYRPECHPTFGQIDGYGLYPFTERSLWIGAGRADQSLPASLNPRVLQNNLLVEVLDTFAPTIEAGEYPPQRLLEKLGGVKNLTLASENLLKGRDAREAGRWTALLELYDGTGTIVNPPASLREAFSVPEIPDVSIGAQNSIPKSVTAPAPAPAPSASPDDTAIESWIRGGGLDQAVAGRLREALFPAIVEALDWDMLGLARTSFAGQSGRPFQRTSISFVRQTTKAAGYLQVKLEIDADPKTGQALQGLLRAAKNDFRWDFPGGDRALGAFLDQLEQWCAEVATQLRRLTAPQPDWSSATAALHLLAVGAAIGGKIRANATAGDVIDAAFAGWAEDPAASAPDLRGLYAKIVKQREDLVTIARSQISSMKGGQAGSMLDPRRALGPVRSLRAAKWRLNQQPPADDQSSLAKLYRDVKAGLEAATRAEQSVRSAWREEMEGAFGAGSTRGTIVATVTAARRAALDAGIGAQNASRALDEALERFGSAYFDDALAVSRTIAQAEDALAILPSYGRGRANAVAAGSALRRATQTFLDAVEQNLESFGGDQAAAAQDVATNVAAVEQSLKGIVESLKGMRTAEETAHAA
ncbi:protein DpdH [Sphingomonas sp. CCH20-B6]|uniref:protein DpdH n=1 Tax=Sphingomonas sp. CCH20-B6 TaxID=1768769 RepID=UPI000B0BAE8F|nr:protein DpdH [Sphingomonas sp. CCH20-B6]